MEVSGYEIDFDKETYSYKIKVDKDVDQIKVKAKPQDSAYTTTVNGDEAKEDDKYKVDVDIKQGENTVTIRVKDEKHDLKTVYELEVIRGSEDAGEDFDEDDVYLDNITLSAGKIDFSSKVTEYTVYIKDPVRYLDIKAKPMDLDNDYVEIDGEDVEEEDDFENTVSLKEGKNKITIRVENDKKVKKYLLKIYNGVEPPKNEDDDEKSDNNNSSQETDNVNNTNNTNNTAKYKNQWVTTQGIWLYYGAEGQPLKNQWYNDASTGKSYFLNENGVMVTGWLLNNGKWYYLNEDGSRHSGWKFLMGLWYYLGEDGVMKTGWFQDTDGKWYYFDEHGVMLRNTTIGGYKLGDSGAKA